MKTLIVLFCFVTLLFSCHNKKEKNEGEKKSETPVVDSLPDAKWNGEYMKIEGEDAPKIQRKSQGSEFYNMGKVVVEIGNDTIDFKLFERKKNALTFTPNSINAFIKSAFNEDVQLQFQKKDIVKHYKGKYTASQKNENNSIQLKVLSNKNTGENIEYTLEKGEAEIQDFNPRLGNLELTFSGTFITQNNIKQKGKGIIKMRFEHAVMTID